MASKSPFAIDAREAIQLAYFDGKTYREVATVMGIPEGTAKSRLRLALRRVASTLESEDLRQWARLGAG